MEGRDLFTHIRSSQGDYDVRAHLAEMVALLGPPPKKLLDREVRWSEVKWSHAVPNSKGKLCQTAREYYGGPFFDSEDNFMHENLIPTDVRIEDSISSLEGEDKCLFLDFEKKKCSNGCQKTGRQPRSFLKIHGSRKRTFSWHIRAIPRCSSQNLGFLGFYIGTMRPRIYILH